MNNQLISQYLYQTQELFGDTLYFKNNNKDINFHEIGSEKSDIVFITSFFSNKDEELMFDKILSALNLSKSKILLIKCKNETILKNSKLKSLINRLDSKTIITLGTKISQFILDTKEDLENLRNKKNFINNMIIIPTYSIQDVKKDISFKRHLWNDLKVIL
ncbi:MAG: hypothetical protein ACJZ03_00865 [Candidatus Neomarinimicrobiota bacterium]